MKQSNPLCYKNSPPSNDTPSIEAINETNLLPVDCLLKYILVDCLEVSHFLP